MWKTIEQKIERLFPGYFSMAMATGALSIAMKLLKIPLAPEILLYLNTCIYITLWILTLIRLIQFFPRVRADLTSHSQGPGFFTCTAATCVYGSQWVIVAHNGTISTGLWFFGILLWVVIMYTFFTAVTVRKEKPSLAEGINGAWLIAAVATQSVSILGTLISSYLTEGREVVLFFTLCMYLLGCMLYLNIITLIFYRFTFVDLKYAALTPPYWINMGAVAITTLAGSTLMLHAEKWPFLTELIPFLRGFTLFFWITGSWWIPLLFILMIWRHAYHRYPLTYDPQFWGMVFPLAMYTTSTYQLSQALKLPFLVAIPRVMIVVALTAWVVVMTGFLHHQVRSFRREGKTR
ncbi:putative membrane protein [compost metagenome]|uniref:Tellurite resistance/C4-dicarboxylate transporter family protein n=1 Tax=Paenibacillus rhizolycopersici TaxID=2780073 RepID=A0ABS2H445_9BACL|nr:MULTISPECIES: tellurite resistance/C4-dicarboxylate transporter family protein [Paenibacillus]MBM6994709.1 tellurite resistance/C4-dicarboxylate transporter family protein [Paenibacillus rhizolycopersici]MUG87088.1 C4-dicarboxylate ABC transporter [Paenibacillus timonensis]